MHRTSWVGSGVPLHPISSSLFTTMSDPENVPNMNTAPDQDNRVPHLHQLDLQCHLLDIERRAAIWQSEQFRKLLSAYSRECTTRWPTGTSQPAPSVATSAPPPPQQQQWPYVRPKPLSNACEAYSCLLPLTTLFFVF